jgi:rRNA N6-adenosine-methyltransferase METTL5
MKLRELESALSEVAAFKEPVVELEQYPTSPHLAARLLHVAASNGDICDSTVLDLGCGGGILGIGAALLGAPHVIGIDVDDAALCIAMENMAEMEVEDTMDLIRADVIRVAGRSGSGLLGVVDTVVMNPPFGTKRKGIDVCFLQVAVERSRGAVYSMHKSSTREFIEKKALAWGTRPELMAQLRFDVPAMYGFHRHSSLDVEVDLWRLDCTDRVAGPLPDDPSAYVALHASVPVPQPAKVRGKGSARNGSQSRGKKGR